MPPLDALSFSSVFDAILHLEESEKMILAATRPALLECPGVWQEAASSVEKDTSKSWPQVKPCEPRGNAVDFGPSDVAVAAVRVVVAR